MSETDFETQLRSIASGLEYPRTPDIAASVHTRLRPSIRSRFIPRPVAWSLTFVLILFLSLMLIPTARAAILEFIQVGVVKIFRVENTPAPSTVLPVTATPLSESQPLVPALKELAGETTLEEASNAVDYQILLPSYPVDLGQPDRVFVQNMDTPMTVLVWLRPEHPDQVLMSLHFLPPGNWAIKKVDPHVIQETQVNGQYAVWTTGPYPMILENHDVQFTRMINGHVLIWTNGTMTYRLETDLSLEEAIKIAESLAPIP